MSEIEQQATSAANLLKVTADVATTTLNIQYIQRDIMEIKQALKDNANQYVGTHEWIDHKKEDQDHETRLRVLESTMWKQVGMSSIISTIIAVGITILIKLYIK